VPDIDIKCQDCGTTFVFTEGEQQWLSDKFGSDYKAPKRCRTCRQQRKLSREGGSTLPVTPSPDPIPERVPARASKHGRRRRDAGDEFRGSWKRALR